MANREAALPLMRNEEATNEDPPVQVSIESAAPTSLNEEYAQRFFNEVGNDEALWLKGLVEHTQDIERTTSEELLEALATVALLEAQPAGITPISINMENPRTLKNFLTHTNLERSKRAYDAMRNGTFRKNFKYHQYFYSLIAFIYYALPSDRFKNATCVFSGAAVFFSECLIMAAEGFIHVMAQQEPECVKASKLSLSLCAVFYFTILIHEKFGSQLGDESAILITNSTDSSFDDYSNALSSILQISFPGAEFGLAALIMSLIRCRYFSPGTLTVAESVFGTEVENAALLSVDDLSLLQDNNKGETDDVKDAYIASVRAKGKGRYDESTGTVKAIVDQIREMGLSDLLNNPDPSIRDQLSYQTFLCYLTLLAEQTRAVKFNEPATALEQQETEALYKIVVCS